MLFIRSCCLLHVHAPLTHMHLGARTARSAVKLENAHTLSAALPMHACLLVATLHLRARGQARANVCQQTKCSAIFDALQTLPHHSLLPQKLLWLRSKVTLWVQGAVNAGAEHLG